MRLCPIHTVSAYALMLAPVYVFMRMNEKFVAVKGPLDFFTPEELQRLAPFESLFMTEFVESTQPFRQTARACRALLVWDPQPAVEVQMPGDSYPEILIAPSSFELSDAVLRLIGPLWGSSSEGPAIEPFFVSVFANELCDPIPFELLLEAREMNVERFEEAIMASSWAVFLALHLGHCDLAFLNQLRLDTFREVALGYSLKEPVGACRELLSFTRRTLTGQYRGLVTQASLSRVEGRSSAKLASRIKRVQEKFVKASSPVPTIYGEKGFADA